MLTLDRQAGVQPEPNQLVIERKMASEDLDHATHRLVTDLHTPRPARFWGDMLSSAAVGWTTFALAARSPVSSISIFAWAALSALALYRGLCFVHEITHLRRRALPGFDTAWNLLFGVPLLLPSFTYVGVHQSHHGLTTYGTKDDPEYLPFRRSRRLIVTFSLQSALLIPLLLMVRFLLLAPCALVWPPFHRWLEAHASSFAMNRSYRRMVSAAMARTMRGWEILILIAWSAAIVELARHAWLPKTIALWFGIMVVVSLLNTLRVLGAHDYETDGKPRDRQAQLRDSIDTPGGAWTELWAPVGLRYHALHHYFPGIPYHNLGIAYRRIVTTLPPSLTYQESTSPGLGHSLRVLYARARSRCSAVIDW